MRNALVVRRGILFSGFFGEPSQIGDFGSYTFMSAVMHGDGIALSFINAQVKDGVDSPWTGPQ